MKTVAQLVKNAALKWPDKNGLVFDQTKEQITFIEIETETNRIAQGLLALGIKPGEKVALMLPNISAFPLSWLALSKIGCVMVPLNYGYKASDAAHLLNHSEARIIIITLDRKDLLDSISGDLDNNLKIIIVDAKYKSVANALENNGDIQQISPLEDKSVAISVSEQTILNIQYTSGTTGMPKGCLLSNHYWVELAKKLVITPPPLNEADVILTAQPFSYIDPQWNTVVALLSGATLVVLDRFSPSSFWSKISDYGVTFFYCLGAMPTLMLAVPVTKSESNHKLRKIICSGIPKARHHELEQRFSVPWYETYGSTETGGDIQVNAETHQQLVGTGSLGFPFSHREVCVVDDSDQPVKSGEIGELVIKGKAMMDGYYKNEAATKESFRNGWYHTGDLASQNTSGEFYLRGRKKDMIRRAGENISAAEVEQTLQQHKLISVAACVAINDELRGEEVKAFLTLVEGSKAEEVDFNNIASFMSERLAAFKIPRYWEIRDTLPMTPSERVAKHLLKEERDYPVGYDRINNIWHNP